MNTDCKSCDWWPLPDLTRGRAVSTLVPQLAWFMCLTLPVDAISRRHTGAAACTGHLPSADCLSYLRPPPLVAPDLVRAAVSSARLNAPSLAPHVIILNDTARPAGAGTHLDDPFMDPLAAWLRSAGGSYPITRTTPNAVPNRHTVGCLSTSHTIKHTDTLASSGVRVIDHALSFRKDIPAAAQRGSGGTAHLNVGAFCRLDVPLLVDSLRAELQVTPLPSMAGGPAS